MPRNYRDDRHPEEASTCRKESAGVFPGNRADVPERRGEIRLLSADCETGSCRGLAPLNVRAAPGDDFRGYFSGVGCFPPRFLLVSCSGWLAKITLPETALAICSGPGSSASTLARSCWGTKRNTRSEELHWRDKS